MSNAEANRLYRIPLFLLLATLHLQVVDAQTRMDSERLARIPTRMQEFVENGRIAGAAMVLARHDGIVLLEAVGYQDLETKTPMRTDAIFRMASVAKPMTALGIMVLQEEGRLALWDRVDRHLPDLRNLRAEATPERPQPVTIHRLLTHTSGMASDLWEQDFLVRSLADVVATYATKPLASPPGTRFIYSDPGFDILGRVIEVVSETPYAAFMENKLFGPLGMEDTVFLNSMWESRDRIPSFYRIEDGHLREDDIRQANHQRMEERVFPAPAVGLYSTAPDLGALLQMLLNDGAFGGGRVLSRASVTAMTIDQIQDDELWWGLGWFVSSRAGSAGGPLASSQAYGHTGLGVSIWVDPENDLAGAFLIHQTGPESASAQNTFLTMAFAAVVDR